MGRLFFFRLVFLGFLGGGGYLLLRFGREIYRGISSRQWRQVRGTVRSARVRQVFDEEGDLAWVASVTYRYLVNGREIEGNRVFFGLERHSIQTDADVVAAQYRAGEPVVVYYSPSDPELSVLRPGLTWAAIGPALAGAALFVFGAVMLIAISLDPHLPFRD
jgi:hypothetical protein